MIDNQEILQKIEALNQVGIALSAQRDTTKLLEQILTNAQQLTNADGGTLYLVTPNRELEFFVIKNDSLNLSLGGANPERVPFSPIPLEMNGEPNLSSIASYVGNKGEAVNIVDIYNDNRFDFSGALKFDQNTNYRTKSMLAFPLKNFNGEVIGVLQLINSLDKNKQSVPFSSESETLASSLASQASVALTNKQLVDEHKRLFESFSIMVADAIDKKSPYTGEHCKRVPVITMMLAKAAIRSKTTEFANFTMTADELFELETAAWLHDCGKLTTPEYIMDKSTKLETIFDRIELLKTRFQLKALQEYTDPAQTNPRTLDSIQQTYENLYQQVEHINSSEAILTEEDEAFLKNLGAKTYTDLSGKKQPLLSEDEVTNLSIKRGTLNDQERLIMQEHATVSIDMLELMPFPKGMQRVPEYAGGHHERMDGKGYPNCLKRDELSIPARIMGIADIFEALSAGDRPYKKPKTLSESLNILGFMKQDGHIDPDLFNLFIQEKVYLEYAKEHLTEDQIDQIDHAKIPGYDGD